MCEQHARKRREEKSQYVFQQKYMKKKVRNTRIILKWIQNKQVIGDRTKQSYIANRSWGVTATQTCPVQKKYSKLLILQSKNCENCGYKTQRR